MRVGIIGAGNIGATLTRRLTALGHDVKVANSRGPESLADLIAETGATAVLAHETVQDVEVLILSIPERSVRTLPLGLLQDARDDLIVIDTGNYRPQRDGHIEEIEAGTVESLYVEQVLGHSVVKTFNTMHAAHLLERGTPSGSPGRLALPVAGDDAASKVVVLRLVDELGFDGVDAGRLDESWRQQPGSPVYATNLDAEGVRRALSEVRSDRLG